MKKYYFRILLLCTLLLAFATVSFAQKTKQKHKRIVRSKIVSTDFNLPKIIVKKIPRSEKIA